MSVTRMSYIVCCTSLAHRFFAVFVVSTYAMILLNQKVNG